MEGHCVVAFYRKYTPEKKNYYGRPLMEGHCVVAFYRKYTPKKKNILLGVCLL